MDELLAKLDAEVATLLAELDPLRERVVVLEADLARMQTAKAYLLGQKLPGRPAGNRIPGTGARIGSAGASEIVAKKLESDGPQRFTDLAKSVKSPLTLVYVLKIQRPEWFTKLNDNGRLKYTLTEAGRNRHKVVA